ncbi:peptidylprolyl isomerase [Aequorivita sp. H23M31]|uniref:peptidylprolyl isomerase n=1 Tax=Aequorivita ciconiae TaxID=2494375 RepID=A0A410G783_9FLAO|nr:peptidylprolyl isomerase [Aequorivita sp. H23M31]QAA83122.1 peptidylprolyl isomerase [Aequorivita sp. H23M31]
MKKLTFFILFLTLAFASCQEKYPDLGDGVYAEFVTNKGTFVAKLYNEATPLTVSNFVALTEGTNGKIDSLYKGKRFYDGLTFHRVIKDFMIQGGDPKGDGSGNPGYAFPDEIVDTLQFDRKGLLAMANSGPATNGSQFFVTLKETPWLNGRHTIFGEVVEGQDVVDAIGNVETEKPGDKPVHPIIIEKVNIINKGKVKVPYFTDEMSKIETEKKEKEERINKISDKKAKEFEQLRAKADSLPSGLKIYYNKKGEGEQPKEGDKILMNYAGYLTNGHLFDSNVFENAEKYEMVDNMRKAAGQYNPVPTDYSKNAQLIPGFREGLLNMKVGDKTTLFIPAHLAYGERGIPGVIPPNSELIFELEIVGINK